MRAIFCAVLFSFCFTELCFAYKKNRQDEHKTDAKIPEFRYDYSYNDGIKGWLKLHVVPASWNEARIRCEREGSELATPFDINMLIAMVSTMENRIYYGVFTGIHSMFSYGDYYSIKGVPLGRMPVSWTKWGPSSDIDKQCIVFLRNGTITNDYCGNASHPYICYKENKNETLGDCGTIDREYNYDRDLNTCYKIHTRKTTWLDAFMTCSAEGGHLLVINSDKELRFVASLLQTYPQEIKMNLFVGIIDQHKSGQWTTIHGDTLEDSGFSRWHPGEPNHIDNAEFCGTIENVNGYNDAACALKLPFICEKQPDSLRNKPIVDITNWYRMAL